LYGDYGGIWYYFGMVKRLLLSSCLRSWGLGLLLAGWLLLGQRAEALVFADSGDVDFNTAAPTGVYADSGWQYLGYFGSFLGTAIGSQYFITAQHIGVQGTTFVQSALFTGLPEVIYTVDTAANGGVGFWDIAGSDLRIYKIEETFASYAELYQGDAVGQVGVGCVGRNYWMDWEIRWVGSILGQMESCGGGPMKSQGRKVVGLALFGWRRSTMWGGRILRWACQWGIRVAVCL